MPGGQHNQWGKLTRNPNGTFKDWAGKRDMSHHGLRVHMGAVFKKQHGRPAQVGEAVRKTTKSGAHHKNSVWWIKTPHGWRRSPTNTRKPSAVQIKAAMKRARPGRGK